MMSFKHSTSFVQDGNKAMMYTNSQCTNKIWTIKNPDEDITTQFFPVAYIGIGEIKKVTV
jgi:hypothetical protein